MHGDTTKNHMNTFLEVYMRSIYWVRTIGRQILFDRRMTEHRLPINMCLI